MGCTSSAPSVVTPDANTASDQTVIDIPNLSYEEDNIKDHEKITTEDHNKTNDLNVLPKCDTVAEPIKLVSDVKSLTDSRNLDQATDNHKMDNAEENNSNNTPLAAIQGDKISSLENIVKQVLDINVTENIQKDSQDCQDEDEKNYNNKEGSNEHKSITLRLNDTSLDKNEADIQKDFNCEKTASPSHSESSHVTRWEALADIAAELPPSLAVDPITGQIYALSK